MGLFFLFYIFSFLASGEDLLPLIRCHMVLLNFVQSVGPRPHDLISWSGLDRACIQMPLRNIEQMHIL